MNIDRVLPYQANPEYRRSRTVESLGMVYKCHYPTHTLKTARGARRSPFHDRLAAQGAYFIETSGWESPGWYAGAGKVADPGPEHLGTTDLVAATGRPSIARRAKTSS